MARLRAMVTTQAIALPRPSSNCAARRQISRKVSCTTSSASCKLRRICNAIAIARGACSS